MNHLKAKMKRLLCGILAFIMVVGLIPMTAIPASADETDGMPDTIKLNNADYSKGYTSDSLGNVILLRFHMDVGGKDVPGFCFDHSKDFDTMPGRTTWGEREPLAADAECRPILDWYMYNYVHSLELEEQNPGMSETQLKEIYDYEYWMQWERLTATSAVQGAIWLYQRGSLSGVTKERIYELVGTERYNGLRTIMGSTYAGSPQQEIDFVKMVYEGWEEGH